MCPLQCDTISAAEQQTLMAMLRSLNRAARIIPTINSQVSAQYVVSGSFCGCPFGLPLLAYHIEYAPVQLAGD